MGLEQWVRKLDKITHIINYELPLNPSVLEQRMLRHGASNEKEFVVFATLMAYSIRGYLKNACPHGCLKACCPLFRPEI